MKDPNSPQYYFSTALCLLNCLNSNPDVGIRIAQHPTIFNDIVEKMLSPSFEDKMRAAPRPAPPGIPPATFEDDFGSLIQFLSTTMLYDEHMASKHPRLDELIPQLRAWNRTYADSRVRTIATASERLIAQIQGTNRGMSAGAREVSARSTVCGYERCGKRKGLTACASCRVQRYCGREHQKIDWKYHKHICNKGLVEGGAEAEAGEGPRVDQSVDC